MTVRVVAPTLTKRVVVGEVMTRFSPEDVKVILEHRLRRRRYREKIRNAQEELKAKQKEKE